MAASAATMQSIFVRPSTRAVVRSSMYLPQQVRSVEFHVRCMSKNQPESSTTPETNVLGIPTHTPAAFTPQPKPKVRTKFTDVLAFSGPAPERINGRLALIGFVAALGVELAR
ncbi:hypothetical protein GIB67_027091 [Kingdonia uniflora]|uniref:Uncharacterized protein n=1 Tax=Kingdonia uniflora TaxID=39325 RepID=A0A7J7P1S5_9MAGN|nr:hypothetical protein GIB67_027091 [Kingdonia uniflora]